MNGEARILQPELSVNLASIEKQPILEEKTMAINDLVVILPKNDSARRKDRFMRLKRHLRKRSASIL